MREKTVQYITISSALALCLWISYSIGVDVSRVELQESWIEGLEVGREMSNTKEYLEGYKAGKAVAKAEKYFAIDRFKFTGSVYDAGSPNKCTLDVFRINDGSHKVLSRINLCNESVDDDFFEVAKKKCAARDKGVETFNANGKVWGFRCAE